VRLPTKDDQAELALVAGEIARTVGGVKGAGYSYRDRNRCWFTASVQI